MVLGEMYGLERVWCACGREVWEGERNEIREDPLPICSSSRTSALHLLPLRPFFVGFDGGFDMCGNKKMRGKENQNSSE